MRWKVIVKVIKRSLFFSLTPTSNHVDMKIEVCFKAILVASPSTLRELSRSVIW